MSRKLSEKQIDMVNDILQWATIDELQEFGHYIEQVLEVKKQFKERSERLNTIE